MKVSRLGVSTLSVALAISLLLNYLPRAFWKESSVSASASVSRGGCVIIDAGHGGFDGGAVASDGTLEKDINLQIALQTADLLKALGFDVIMTRDSDGGLENPDDKTIRQKKISDMRARLGIIESNQEGLFVSIHLNKYTTEAPRGTQVFYSPNNPLSLLLAQSIQDSVHNMLQPENARKIKKSGSDTMLLYRAQIPAVIVECGFLSNSEELRLLKNTEYQNQMAICIVSGIINYLESEE